MKVHRQKTQLDVEDAIAEVLRHAPHRPGGSKYKVCLNLKYKINSLQGLTDLHIRFLVFATLNPM